MSEPASQNKRKTLRRSKEGCLICRRKRKKCDENWPSCSRCTRTGSHCIWPPPQSTSVLELDSLMDVHTLQGIPLGIEAEIAAANLATNSILGDSAPHFYTNGSLSLHPNSDIWDFTAAVHSENPVWPNPEPIGPSPPTWANPTVNRADISTPMRHCAVPNSRVTKSLAVRMWEYAHDFGPRIIWPPEGCINCDELDPEGVAPAFRQSLVALSREASVEAGFQDVCYFYTTFLTRLFYDYSLPTDALAKWVFRRFNASNSSRYGMLSLAALYRSDYQKSMLATSWRADAKEMYSLAVLQLPHDLEDTKLSPWEKLTGLLGIMDFEHTVPYWPTIQVLRPQYPSHTLIKAIVGSDTIDLFDLQGEQMFDVNIWVWCDILDSMATSKPTRLKYESDLECAAQPGMKDSGACQNKGLEWIYGVPNAFAVVLARTSMLRDAKLPEQEKATKGTELEQLVRDWQIRLLGTKGHRFRVARVGAQEIWRHTCILYIHHAIFKSDSSHPIVKDSVKNIIKIACTLEPGRNPDSFLYIPYFIAGFYAVSQKDRYIMKSRLIGCGNALYLRNLARNLDELWQETDSVGRLTSWSEKKPPRIAF
ncbi:unnamed protein product [Rhizoctonia solani]|uniref:Zn(2)-C6 fungal-type domain-containing protein n=1 Tax=Rhizoctonia solani TaxID=456999 RepID=A0A8H3BZD6_9AGAM|nr:unnamed protein product [Rhizoctonia solani]